MVAVTCQGSQSYIQQRVNFTVCKLGLNKNVFLKYMPMIKNWTSVKAQLVKNPPAMQENPGAKMRWRRDRLPTPVLLGLPYSSAGEESACNVGRPGLDPWAGKIPRRRETLLTPVLWPGEFHGLHRPRGRKESDTTERLSLYMINNSAQKQNMFSSSPQGLPNQREVSKSIFTGE